MEIENPYDSPNDKPVVDKSGSSLLLWSVVTVFGSALVCGMIGLGVGRMIGKYAPGYYRSIIGGSGETGYDEVIIGSALGFAQGAGVGMAVGLILVGMSYWYRSRIIRGTTA